MYGLINLKYLILQKNMYMKKIITFVILLTMLCGTFVSTTSCEGKKQRVPSVGKAQSAPYELLLVANKDWLKTMAGQTLTVVLNSPIEGLPQPESHFRLTTVNPRDFSGVFRQYSNVIEVKIGHGCTEAKVTMKEDVYCRPQLLITLEAPNDEEFVNLVRERADIILSLFDDREIARERDYVKKHYSGKVLSQVKKQFGAEIYVPQDIDDIKTGKGFMWASDSKNEFRLNTCVYTLPLKNMTLDDFVAGRDSVMKINIPGDKDNQWMETEGRSVTFKAAELEQSAVPVIKVHGLWDMKNDAMGGPFVAYVYTDHVNNRLLVVEGFIFAPQKEKRAMIRELEGALQTVVLPK